MIKTWGEERGDKIHDYKRIEIVEIDGKRYVRKKRIKKVFYKGEWQHVQGARKVHCKNSVDTSQ